MKNIVKIHAEIKRISLFIIYLCCFTSSNIFGINLVENKEGVKFDLQISSDFQIGAPINQSNLTDKEKNVSSYNPYYAHYNNGSCNMVLSKLVGDTNYGAELNVIPDLNRSGSGVNRLHIFIDGKWGMIEAGSAKSAPCKLSISASSIIAGSGSADRYVKTEIEHLSQGSGIYPTFMRGFNMITDPAGSISYYTPEMSIADSTGIKIGFTYIADSSNTGISNFNKVIESKTSTKKISDGRKVIFDNSVKHVFGGGINFTHHFTDGVDIKLSLTGEYGKAAGSITVEEEENDKTKKEYEITDLKTMNFGFVLNTGNASIASSIGSHFDSLSNKDLYKDAKNYFFTVAGSYKFGPVKVSLGLTRSTKYENISNKYDFALDYQINSVLKSYLEVSRISLEGKPELSIIKDLKDKQETRSTVILLGLKLKF